MFDLASGTELYKVSWPHYVTHYNSVSSNDLVYADTMGTFSRIQTDKGALFQHIRHVLNDDTLANDIAARGEVTPGVDLVSGGKDKRPVSNDVHPAMFEYGEAGQLVKPPPPAFGLHTHLPTPQFERLIVSKEYKRAAIYAAESPAVRINTLGLPIP